MTSMNDEYREVDFKTYCPKCKRKFYPEEADICSECLAEPMNKETCKPVNYKEASLEDLSKRYEKTYTKEEKKYGKAIGNVFDI